MACTVTCNPGDVIQFMMSDGLNSTNIYLVLEIVRTRPSKVMVIGPTTNLGAVFPKTDTRDYMAWPNYTVLYHLSDLEIACLLPYGVSI